MDISTKKLKKILLTAIVLILSAMVSCTHRQSMSYADASGYNTADSIISDIGDNREFQRLITVTDSFEHIGEIPKVRAIFYTTRGKEICVFNSYGEIVETWVMGKNDNLSATIQDYLKKEYKSYKLKEFYSVKRLADKLNAYKVIIVDKKTQEEQELWFNLSGKPIEY